MRLIVLPHLTYATLVPDGRQDATDPALPATMSLSHSQQTARIPKHARSSARERILEAAYELFSQHGIRGVGIDSIIERSGVARMTLYRHFHSKDALVLAFLQRREQRWTYEWLAADATRRGSTPQEQLLAIFDVFDEWFRRDDFEGCSFINILLEMGPGHPLGTASA